MRVSVLLTTCFLLLVAAIATPATLIIANKSDHTVDLVDPATGVSSATLPTGLGPHEVVASPDGTIAVVADYGDRPSPGSTLTVIDLLRAKVIRTIDLGEYRRPHGLSWIEGDRIAVTAEENKTLLVVDVAIGKVVQAISTDQDVSHMVVVTPDRKKAFVANIGSGTTTVIDLVKGQKVKDLETGAGAEGIAMRPDTNEVWVTNREADTLSVIDSSSNEVVASVACAGFPIRIAFTPDGSHALVSAARTGEVVRFDAAVRKELSRKKLDLQNAPDAAKRLFGDQFGESPVPVGIQMAPDGKSAFVAATQSDVVVRVNAETLEVEDLIRAGHEPDGMAVAN